MLSPIGASARRDRDVALSWLSLAALALVRVPARRRLFSRWVGAAFAAILVTRGLLVRETQQAIVDVPFLALVLAALVEEARRPREGLRVPLLLCLAGLLRPGGVAPGRRPCAVRRRRTGHGARWCARRW